MIDSVSSVSVVVKYISVFKDILSLNFRSCPVSVYMASANKDDVVPRYAHILMTEKLTDGFRDIIENIKMKYLNETKGNNTLFSEYYIESVLEDNEIECLEVATRNTLAEQIEPLKLLTDIEIFSEENDFIDGMRFYVIVAQPEKSDPVYFFHIYTPRKILRRTGLHAVLGSRGEYDRAEEKYISFEESIDCIYHSGYMFVINKDRFRSMFRFLEEVRVTTRETLQVINCSLPIQNFDELLLACEENRTMSNKLMKIATKPYIKDLKMSDVKKIIESNHLPVKIVEVEGQEKILFDPKAKAKEKY